MENNNVVAVSILIVGALVAGAIYFRPPAESLPAAVFAIEDLSKMARQADLNRSDFKACLESGKYAEKVAADTKAAVEVGAQGTPYPIIVTKSGETLVLPGAVAYEDLKPILDNLLAGKKAAETVAAITNPGLREAVTTTLPKPLPPITESDHLNGSPEAALTVVEYSDLDCPFCKRFNETMNQVMAEYGTEGQVARVYRHFPLSSIHPNAAKLAEATECAAELGGEEGFWKFTEALFAAH